MLGLDVGGTKIELAIFDDEFELVDSWRTPTPKNSYEEFLRTVADMVATADDKLGAIQSVGIGIPGFVDKDGRSVSANVPCLTGRYLHADLPERLDRLVGIDSDTRNFVYSEANGGAGHDSRYVLGIILGTGVSGNFSVDGNLWRGANAMAGEVGHIALPASSQQKYNLPLRHCGCGIVGCVEPYLAGPGLLWMSHHFGGDFRSVAHMMECFRSSDPIAQRVFSTYIDCLGTYFVQLTHIFDPDVIVLGGGLSKIPEIFENLPSKILEHLIPGFAVPPVVKPRFGDSSGVRGAAMIGRIAAAQDRA